MNKAELIESIADSADLSKASAGRALDAAIESITKALKKAIPLPWLVSELFLFVTAQQEWDVTQELVKRSKLRLQKYQDLSLAKH